MEIQEVYQQKCLICTENVEDSNAISLTDETIKTLYKELIDSIISQIVEQHKNGITVWHSDIICKDCFDNFNQVHEMELKLREQKLQLMNRFKHGDKSVDVEDLSNDFTAPKKILNIPSSDEEQDLLEYNKLHISHQVDDEEEEKKKNIQFDEIEAEIVKIHGENNGESQVNSIADGLEGHFGRDKVDEEHIFIKQVDLQSIKTEVEDDKSKILKRTINIIKKAEAGKDEKRLVKEEVVPEAVLERNEDIFCCRLCDNDPTGCGKARIVMAHLKQVHDIRLYICDVCGDIFKKRNDMSAHMDAHVEAEDGDFQCEVCHRIFNSLRLFRIHRRMHYPQNKGWTCDRCGKKYSSKNLLEEHMNTHTGYRPYVCNVCGKSFASKYTYKAHEKTHEARPRPHKCSTCSKTFLSIPNLIQHEKSHAGIKNYVCHLCDKKFGSAHNLEVHSIVHTGYRPFICGLCGKAFARKAEIRDHERTHTGERPYQCEFCGATFSQRSNLQSHKRATHYDDKRYKCPQCKKGFKRRRLLEYHIKAAHTGERPFKCSICDASFVYPEHFKKHRRIHTGEKPFLCEVCGKAFNSRDNRNAHRFVHSDKKPYECMVCGAGFMRKPLLYQHMQAEGHLNDTIVVNQPRLPSETEQFLTLNADGQLEITQHKVSRLGSDLDDMEEVNVDINDSKLFISEHMLVDENGKPLESNESTLVLTDGTNETIIINGEQFQFKGEPQEPDEDAEEDTEIIEEEEEEDDDENETFLATTAGFEGIITPETLAAGQTQIIHTKDGPVHLLAVRIPNDNGEEEEAWIKILPDSTTIAS